MHEPCPTCGHPVVSVDLHPEGRTVTMHSCNRCDRRWWTAEGLPVDPAEVFTRQSA